LDDFPFSGGKECDLLMRTHPIHKRLNDGIHSLHRACCHQRVATIVAQGY
jgi:hypothetical protein